MVGKRQRSAPGPVRVLGLQPHAAAGAVLWQRRQQGCAAILSNVCGPRLLLRCCGTQRRAQDSLRSTPSGCVTGKATAVLSGGAALAPHSAECSGLCPAGRAIKRGGAAFCSCNELPEPEGCHAQLLQVWHNSKTPHATCTAEHSLAHERSMTVTVKRK